MPKPEMPAGALVLLILRVLRSGPLHGLRDRPTHPHPLVRRASRGGGLAVSGAPENSRERLGDGAWGTSETGRKVRFYKLTRDGVKQLEAEASQFERQTKAIQAILRTA
jgi:hypothetical protein